MATMSVGRSLARAAAFRTVVPARCMSIARDLDSLASALPHMEVVGIPGKNGKPSLKWSTADVKVNCGRGKSG